MGVLSGGGGVHVKEPGEAMEGFASAGLAGRVSTPKNISGLALLLTCSDADCIIGQVIGVGVGIDMF